MLSQFQGIRAVTGSQGCLLIVKVIRLGKRDPSVQCQYI